MKKEQPCIVAHKRYFFFLKSLAHAKDMIVSWKNLSHQITVFRLFKSIINRTSCQYHLVYCM